MINGKDKMILRDLAKKVSDIAGLDVMRERRSKWYRHNDLKTAEPLIVVYPEGAWDELLPHKDLKCEDGEARGIEWNLLSRIYYHENIDDDSVIKKDWVVHKNINGLGWNNIDLAIDWGMGSSTERSQNNPRGAYRIDTAIKNIGDIKKLKIPRISCDEQKTLADFERKQELFGDILDVKLKGITHVGFHIMYFYIHLRGLEQTYLDFYDQPEFAKELIGFFESGLEDIVNQCLELNLFGLNNDDTYVGTGGFGNTNELPAKNFDPDNVRLYDIWGSAEAQEMSSVSPEMTEEFVIQCERRLLSRFGLTAYGCCEALDDKLPYILRLPNMRRLSISPFADVKKCAEILQNKYIYSWKPNPSYVCSPEFDTAAIKKYLTEAKEYTKNCVLEIILADTHTCHNQVYRFKEWVEICRNIFQK